ncbi:MAG: hypothetical protein GY839_18820 [candidate division Zixibacteria bacterium]|nr:hypothetical protein [candidate division Zixibacteria bacterium]
MPEALKKPIEYKEIGNSNKKSLKNDHLSKPNDPLNDYEAALGMPIATAIEIWHSRGAPEIQLGPGEKCNGLEKLLSRPDVRPAYLKAIADWLKQSHHGRFLAGNPPPYKSG